MIVDKSIKDYINELKSKSPVPGGGAVAALTSAQGAALIMMVANLTVSNNKYVKWHEQCKEILEEAETILQNLIAGIDEDAEAFKKVMSKDAGETEIKAAIEAPLAVMRNSDKALLLNEKLWEKSNPNLESDLLISAQNLVTGMLSAKANIDINLKGIEKIDVEYVVQVENEVQDLVSKWCPGEDSNLRHPL